LRNIFGPVNLQGKRPNAAVPLRNSRGTIDKEDSNSQSVTNDEYDFLRPKSPSSTPKIQFDDLASAAVSKLVHAGLTFWEPEAKVKEEIDPPNIVESSETTNQDIALDNGDDAMGNGSQEHKDVMPQPSTELASAPDRASTDERAIEVLGQPAAHDNGCVLT
jgi:hypothetical protein